MITITIGRKGNAEEKFEFKNWLKDHEKVLAPIVWIGSFGYFNRGLNSILKPQRNFGYLLNAGASFILADFVTANVFKKEVKEEPLPDCENVKAEDVSENEDN